ncbi:MAG: hypothetical protein GY925_18750 [Actinomycetia bacterium]|nr:hypothetical protein [Actinomycetes bacterium]
MIKQGDAVRDSPDGSGQTAALRVLGIVGAVMTVVGALLAGSLNELQQALDGSRFETALASMPDARRNVWADIVVMAPGYLGLCVALMATRTREPKRRVGAGWSIGFIAGAFVADQIENILVLSAISEGSPDDGLVSAIRMFGSIKWTLIIGGVIAAFVALIQKPDADDHFFRWRSRWHRAMVATGAVLVIAGSALMAIDGGVNDLQTAIDETAFGLFDRARSPARASLYDSLVFVPGYLLLGVGAFLGLGQRQSRSRTITSTADEPEEGNEFIVLGDYTKLGVEQRLDVIVAMSPEHLEFAEQFEATQANDLSKSRPERSAAAHNAANIGSARLANNRRAHRAIGGMVLVVLAAVADWVENITFVGLVDSPDAASFEVMRSAGTVKLAMFVLALSTWFWFISHRPVPRRRPRPHDSMPDSAMDDWHPSQNRRGVCLSGGGIRSAAFSMGAVQALDDDALAPPSEKSYVKRSRYLAAVSGGGYFGAGFAASNYPADRSGATNGWATGSPEERHFRDNSSYLVPDLWQGVRGFSRLAAGVVVNVAVIWLALFVVARPVGWLMNDIHPQLATPGSTIFTPSEPIELGTSLTIIDPNGGAALEDGDVLEFQLLTSSGWTVCFAPGVRAKPCEHSAVPATPDPGKSENVGAFTATVEPLVPGLVRWEAGTVEITRQPLLGLSLDSADSDTSSHGSGSDCNDGALIRPLALVDGEAVFAPGTGDDVSVRNARFCVELSHDVVLLEDTARSVDDIGKLLVIDGDAQVVPRSISGLAIRPGFTPRDWMWAGSIIVLAIGLIASMSVMFGRFTGRIRWAGRLVGTSSIAAGLLVFMLLVGLPWMVTDGLRAVARMVSLLPGVDGTESALGSGLVDYVLPSGGFLAIIYTALQGYLASNKGAAGSDPTAGTARRIWNRFRGLDDKLGWYELSISKIVATVVAAVVPFILFVTMVQYASANGPSGRLMGFAFIRDSLPDSLVLPELTKFVLVVIGLGLFHLTADASSWSLHPFYKQRLSKAYLVDRADPLDTTAPVHERPYDQPLTFQPLTKDAASPGLLKRTSDEGETGPQLVVCCAVNLSDEGAVPPARRAASWTFSADYTGGPVVGWHTTSDYWEAMDGLKARQLDLTVPSAMSISGAAFSPAMGKFNLGPLGTALAVANLRLGVWLPHPAVVDKRPSRSWWRINRPGWGWFLREYRNKYKFDSDYLYVSDGGHWENLGLVELLRRGCTEIVCINAGGDSQEKFTTIGEAIALAREDLGVEVTIDPSPLRPPQDPGDSDRELRRPQGQKAMSEASFAVGTIQYPARNGRRDYTGRLFLIEPALTDDIPFDVHSYAESVTIFPDDSTGDQVFNHRQFESFRALGHHQAERLLDHLRLEWFNREFGSNAAPPGDDGQAPDGFTVKGNIVESANNEVRRYHTPGSPNYAATDPEVWFRSPSDAEAHGFERSGGF